jgi:hypothetical protein
MPLLSWSFWKRFVVAIRMSLSLSVCVSSILVPTSLVFDCRDDDENHRTAYLQSLIASLPPANRALLHYLVLFLCDLLVNEEFTKMGPSNLGIVFGPLLIPQVCASNHHHHHNACNLQCQ